MGGTSMRKSPAPSKAKAPVKKEPAWKSKNNSTTSSSAAPGKKMSWREKQEAKKKAEAASSSSSYSGGGSGSLGARKDKIVNKLKNAQEWQLKAIEKILQ